MAKRAIAESMLGSAACSALVCLMMAVAPAVAASGELWFESVTDSDGYGEGVITALAQDAGGLIWVGTPAGLLRYDGYRFRSFARTEVAGLERSYVRVVLPLDDGRLLIGAQGAGLVLHDPARESFEPGPRLPPGDAIVDSSLAMVADGEGGVWVGFAAAGLFHWDGSSDTLQPIPLSVPAGGDAGAVGTVRSLLVDSQGGVWAGTRDGLYRRPPDGGSFQRVLSDPTLAEPLAGQYVYTLDETSGGRIWVGTQASGLLRTDLDVQGWQHVDDLTHPWVSGVLELNTEDVWVFTYGGGINQIDADSLAIRRVMRHDPSLPGGIAMDRLLTPIKDESGLIWFGTWGNGLQFHNPQSAASFQTFRQRVNQQDSLSHTALFTSLALPDGHLWVATAGNGIDVLDAGLSRVAGYRPAENLPGSLADGSIRALARSVDGTLWVGSHQAGLHRYRATSDDFVLHNEGLPDLRIRALLAGAYGGLWVGTQRGPAWLPGVDQSAELQYRSDGSLIEEPVWAMAQTGDGTLWISTPTNLLWRAATQDAWQLYRSPVRQADSMLGEQALSRSAVTDLLIDSNDQLWVLGSEGLFRFVEWRKEQPVFTSVLALEHGVDVTRRDPSAQRTRTVSGSNLLADQQGRLWTPRWRLDPDSGQLISFSRADGVDVGNFELGAGAVLSGGRLAYAGTRGLLIIDTESFSVRDYVPPLAITRLEVGGRVAPLQRLEPKLRLSPEERRLAVEFASLDYAEPARNLYAFRIEGLDEHWIEVNADNRVAAYSNLWPGQYTLHLRGSNRHGVWDPARERRITIVVEALWWQLPATWLLAALLLIAMLAAGVHLRTHRISRHAEAMERQVGERTADLRLAKQAAEQALGELRETQGQLVQAEKMAALGQLVAGVAHEINTPLGVAVTAASHLNDLTVASAPPADNTEAAARLLQLRSTVASGTRLLLSSLNRAHNLVASFRQLAVDQGSESRREVELAALAEQIRLSFGAECRQAGHELRIDVPGDLRLSTYPASLLQVLEQGVRNALDHAYGSEQKGEIRLIARCESDASVLLEVIDDGVGINDTALAKAFDPFFTTRRGHGAPGLGLHLAYLRVTRILGGDIGLERNEGSGLRLWIRLPIDP